MKVSTNVKAGGLYLHNHNETLLRAPRGLRVKSNLKAGGLNFNHNETLLRD